MYLSPASGAWCMHVRLLIFFVLMMEQAKREHQAECQKIQKASSAFLIKLIFPFTVRASLMKPAGLDSDMPRRHVDALRASQMRNFQFDAVVLMPKDLLMLTEHSFVLALNH